MTPRIRKAVAIVLVASLTAAALPRAEAAGLQSEMDSLFGSMSNVTSPGIWDTQRRGVFTGGQYSSKNKIVSENIVGFVPPSFEAGCGGIDLFGGSFSFINADQFVQLMRGVASNAAGYAFQLALGAMCQDCAAIIENLQKKIQELNQFFGNSCQLAQGIVNDTLGATLKKQENEASKISFTKGIGDIFQSWTQSSGESPTKSASRNAPADFKKNVQGNIVWRALKTHAVSGWFTHGDEDMLEAMMNITGTVIVGAMQSAPDGKGEAPAYSELPGNKVRIRDLMEGTNGVPIRIQSCGSDRDADGCTSLTPKSIEIRGFKKMLTEILLDGNGGTPGLVTRIATNQGTLSAADQAFLSPQRYGLAGLIFQLAKHGQHGAKSLAERAIPHLAYDMAHIMLDDMTRAVEAAVSVSKDPNAEKMLQRLKASKDDLRAEQVTIRGQIGDPTELYKDYLSILDITRKVRYAATGQARRD